MIILSDCAYHLCEGNGHKLTLTLCRKFFTLYGNYSPSTIFGLPYVIYIFFGLQYFCMPKIVIHKHCNGVQCIHCLGRYHLIQYISDFNLDAAVGFIIVNGPKSETLSKNIYLKVSFFLNHRQTKLKETAAWDVFLPFHRIQDRNWKIEILLKIFFLFWSNFGYV